MHKKLIAPAIISILSLITTGKVLAATDSLGRKHPTAILVQLSAEVNRKTALAKDRKYKDLEEVTTDAQRVMEVTINDFKDHFTYCPVYYFIDTNVVAIKNKQFDGVLMNADGTLVNNPIVSKDNIDYFIAYYGYPNVQPKQKQVATDQPSSSTGRGLIILNNQYKQISYSVDPDYIALNFLNKKKKNPYSYIAKHFNMQYIPYAREFSERLEGSKGNFKGFIPKKNKKK